MKKVLYGILLSVGCIASQARACIIHITNNLPRTVTIQTSNEAQQRIAAYGGSLTIGKSDQRADFTLTKYDRTYHIKQTSCSKSHKMTLYTADVGYKDIPHFAIEEQKKSHARNSSCCK